MYLKKIKYFSFSMEYSNKINWIIQLQYYLVCHKIKQKCKFIFILYFSYKEHTITLPNL